MNTLRFLVIAYLCQQLLACNFQYGSISYEWISTRTMKFTIESQWLRNFTRANCGGNTDSVGQVWGLWSMLARAGYGDVVDVVGANIQQSTAISISFDPGDGTQYPIKLEVLDFSEAENFIHGYTYIYHTYAAPASLPTNFLAKLQGCCWQANANNSVTPPGQFRVTARLQFKNNGPSLIVRALPIQTVGPNVTGIFIPASTPSGKAAVYYRVGQGNDEKGDAVLSPAIGFIGPDYLKGYLSFDGKALIPGATYPVIVEIAAQGSNPTFVPYVFTARVLTRQEWRSKPYFQGTPLMTDPSTGTQVLSNGKMPVLVGYVGYELFITIRAVTQKPGASILKIRSFSMVEGSYLSNERADGVAGNSSRSVDWRWTPGPSQSGQHYACFEAVDDNVTDTLSSGQHCFAVSVGDVLPQPMFTSPPAAGMVVWCFMGTRVTVEVSAMSQNPYEVLTVGPSDPLLYGQQLVNTDNRTGRVRATDSAAAATVTAEWVWKPMLTMGGYNATVCFNLAALGPAAMAPLAMQQRCIAVVVRRCMYKVHDGDSFESIAQMFGSNWLTIWAINVNYSTLELTPGDEILIGKMYIVEHGETIGSIASQLGTSVAAVRQLNFDYNDQHALAPLPYKATLCVFPDTCAD